MQLLRPGLWQDSDHAGGLFARLGARAESHLEGSSGSEWGGQADRLAGRLDGGGGIPYWPYLPLLAPLGGYCAGVKNSHGYSFWVEGEIFRAFFKVCAK